MTLKRSIAVFQKDLQSEFKTRYSISAIALFILTTVTMLAFAMSGEGALKPDVTAGLLWLIMFFGAMTGLSRTFVSEEERGTSFLLHISTTPAAVYFGKLIFNILLSLAINIFSVLLFFLLIGGAVVKDYTTFSVIIILGSIGIASVSTITSAIISLANTKGALFPVLSFPIILPLIILAIEITKASFENSTFAEIQSNLLLLVAYCGIIITASFLLFDFIWNE
jgi:heme exporter protein B